MEYLPPTFSRSQGFEEAATGPYTFWIGRKSLGSLASSHYPKIMSLPSDGDEFLDIQSTTTWLEIKRSLGALVHRSNDRSLQNSHRRKYRLLSLAQKRPFARRQGDKFLLFNLRISHAITSSNMKCYLLGKVLINRIHGPLSSATTMFNYLCVI